MEHFFAPLDKYENKIYVEKNKFECVFCYTVLDT